MGKFSLLKFYRRLLRIAAVLSLLGSVAMFLFTPLRGTYSYSSDLLIAFVAALPFLGLSLGFGIIAEIITLFLHMEDHLDKMRQEQARTNQLLLNPPQGRTVSPASNPTAMGENLSTFDPFSAAGPSQAVRSTPKLASFLDSTIVAYAAFVYDQPDEHSKLLGRVLRGRAVKLYGRDASSQWVCGDTTGTKWIRVSQLSVSGDISTLPIITPPPTT